MIKKLLSTAAVLFFITSMAAVLPHTGRKDLQKAASEGVKKTYSVENASAPGMSYECPDPLKSKPWLAASLSQNLEPLEMIDAYPSSGLDSIMGYAKDGLAKAVRPLFSGRKVAGVPTLVTGTIISKDLNYKGVTYGYRLELEEIENTDSVSVNNLYGLGSKVSMYVDRTTGRVSIPRQKVYQHSSYGEVSVVPLSVNDKGGFVMPKGDIEGTLSGDGTITLGMWGVAVTQMDEVDGVQTPSANYGALFNIFSMSVLNVPNAIVSCNDISQNKITMYEVYLEQSSANELMLYGFCNITQNDVLAARLTADKRIVVSTQVIYTNMMYGPFCNYPATFTLDSNTNKWKVSVDTKKEMELKSDGEGGYSLPGWVIAGKASPSQYIGYAYDNVQVETDLDIRYPDPVKLEMAGSGTVDDPYKVATLNDFLAISQSAELGESFAGVNFSLSADLDFSGVSPTGYVPVGTASAPFEGVFHGNGKKISNFKVDGKGFKHTGLFGVIGEKGEVRDLVMEGASITSQGINLGVVAATCAGKISGVTVKSSVVNCDGELGGGIVGAQTAGIIENCTFDGNITSVGSGAGIAAQMTDAEVRNCHVIANITLDGAMTTMSNHECGGIIGTVLRSKISGCYVSGMLADALGYGYIGGIAAYSNQCEITGCFNAAAISAKRANMGNLQDPNAGDTYTGGLVGYISSTDMNDCYNSGTIVKTDKSYYVGGLVGYLGVGFSSTSGRPTEMINISHVLNCYNSGQIVSYATDSHKGIFGHTFLLTSYQGPSPEEVCFDNCFFDMQVQGAEDEKYGLSTREMTGKLPSGFDSNIWKAEGGRYPVLASVGTGTPAQELSAAPLTLRENDNSNKVKVEFSILPSSNVEWTLSHDAEAGESATETAALRMKGSKVLVKDRYANSIITAATPDGAGMKLYRLSVVPKLFDGEGTAYDPYLIKSVDDFKILDNAVGGYGQTHEGDYFILTNDVDFAGGDEFHGVGYRTNREFHGSFNGCGHKISGLKIDAGVYDDKGTALNTSYIYSGLFGIIGDKGSVRNIVIGDDCDFTFYGYGGAVAGLSSGTIENCRNYAVVNGIQSYIGGIVGVNYDNGRVVKCYNAGAVNVGVSNAGGIAGYNRATGVIELCQNDADVMNKVVNTLSLKTKTNTVGGVVGYNYGVVSSSVNNGQVRAYNTVGGIAGKCNNYENAGDLTACLNNGLVTAIDETLYRGGVAGEFGSGCKMTDVYYDSSINVNGAANNNSVSGAKGLSSSEMISGNALEGLDDMYFDFSADSYPVLKAFVKEEASKALRSIYVGFAPKMLRTNVLAETPLSNAQGVVFTLEKAETFGISDGKLTVIKPEGMTVAADSLTAVLGEKYVKSYNISAVPVILKGEGTEESPYLIETAADWNKLAEFMEVSKWEYSGNHFRITSDLDFQNDSIKLMAVNGVNFQALLDGAGHTVKNYVYSNANSVKTKLQGPNLYVGKYLGLIGSLGSAGVVKNMTLNGNIKGYGYIASTVGENYGRIENVINLGSVETLTDGYAGGIAVRSYDGSVISGCANEGSVLSKKMYANGIAYETKAGSLLENCINRGAVTATTTYACGIAYKVAGTLKGCVNEGALAATGTASGIAYTLDATAHMEDCVNKSDIDFSGLAKPGGNIFGIASTLTAVKTPDPESDGAKVINCHNEGNLKGGANVFGAFSAINAGWTITGCSNTGNLESTGLACGFGKSSGNGKEISLLTTIKDCFNTGNVIGNNAGVSGFLSEASKFTDIIGCYNLGDVTNMNSGMTTAGMVAKHNGVMDGCFNAGNVYSMGNSVGGLVGYIATGDLAYPAKILNSFNIGDITTDYTGTNTNGNAGGLGGYLSTSNEDAPHVVENCYNTGNVTASKRVAGLFAGAFRPSSVVRNCYNSGKITCLDPDDQGRYYWSGTTFSNNYEYKSGDVVQKMLAGHSDCFYDVTVNPGNEFRTVPGSKKTTEELRDLEISDAFVLPGHGGYPILKDFAEADAANAGSALILLSAKENEAHGNVTSEVTLVAPAGAEWTASDIKDEASPETRAESTSACLKIEEGKAIPTASGKVLLTCTYKGMSKNFTLDVNYTATSGLDEQFSGKEIKSTQLIDLQGRTVVEPEAGVVYIVKTVYTDGTMKIEKKIAVK